MGNQCNRGHINWIHGSAPEYSGLVTVIQCLLEGEGRVRWHKSYLEYTKKFNKPMLYRCTMKISVYGLINRSTSIYGGFSEKVFLDHDLGNTLYVATEPSTLIRWRGITKKDPILSIKNNEWILFIYAMVIKQSIFCNVLHIHIEFSDCPIGSWRKTNFDTGPRNNGGYLQIFSFSLITSGVDPNRINLHQRLTNFVI